jgi:hypothetical protein
LPLRTKLLDTLRDAAAGRRFRYGRKRGLINVFLPIRHLLTFLCNFSLNCLFLGTPLSSLTKVVTEIRLKITDLFRHITNKGLQCSDQGSKYMRIGDSSWSDVLLG